jgi:hypothetical protein
MRAFAGNGHGAASARDRRRMRVRRVVFLLALAAYASALAQSGERLFAACAFALALACALNDLWRAWLAWGTRRVRVRLYHPKALGEHLATDFSLERGRRLRVTIDLGERYPAPARVSVQAFGRFYELELNEGRNRFLLSPDGDPQRVERFA